MARILVIEDEASLRETILEVLTFEGYEAIGAANGLEGVAFALEHNPDLIICDITMPGLDGYGVLLEIQSNPITVFTPFIFLTARASPQDVRRGMEYGADDYLVKPFLRDELLQAVQARLNKKAVQERGQQEQVDLLQGMLNQEREQNMLKTKLVAMFSHELRNPLIASPRHPVL